jgi:RNA polymerase sigma factor (sigma-70 family)
MSSPASHSQSASLLLSRLAKEDRGRILSGLIARLGDFQLAEDALQEAMIAATQHWQEGSIPNLPMNWIMQVAYRKAIDKIRQRKTEQRAKSEIAILAGEEAFESQDVGDERLSLIFTCCHPALDQKSQVALTLRTIGGLSTAEIACAFLDAEPTMGQRLSRAKAKIAAARIPYKVPEMEEWPQRLQAVLAVIYLIFNAGYSSGPTEGAALVNEALYLGQMLDRLRPDEAEIEGCVALMLITNGRRGARVDMNGVTVALSKQDRSLWDKVEIEQGIALIDKAVTRHRPGPYQIKAAIAACHNFSGGSDWKQIAALYSSLLHYEPSAVVRLNHAVAIAEAGELDKGLAVLRMLRDDLAQYQPFHAAHAELLARQGFKEEAKAAYLRAIGLALSKADIQFLTERQNKL